MIEPKEFVKAIAGALLSTLVAVLFALVRQRVGTSLLLLSILFVISLFAIYAGVDAYRRADRMSGGTLETLARLSDTIKSLEHTIKSHIRFTWIISSEQLMAIEKAKTRKCQSIWILTSDPSDDTGTSPWVQVIRNNLVENIKYTYVCLDDKQARGRINGLKETFRHYYRLCNIITISSDEYEKFPYSHIVVYDPLNDNGEMECYGEINAPERGFWLQLSISERNTVIHKLMALAHMAKDLSSYK